MASEIGAYNLDRDKRVVGKKWLQTYGGWFSDEENIQMFIDAVKPFLPNQTLDILYLASASGLLGERLIENLGKGKLTLVDISQKHLNENKNPETNKIHADILEMNLNKKFDLIIMRSSLDYFPSKDSQIRVLKIAKDHLKTNGIFINQPAFITDPEDRNKISEAYNGVDKIGKRLFQTNDINSIYISAGFSNPEKIGEGKVMEISEKDHKDRYNLNTQEIKLIQKILAKNSDSISLSKNGYKLRFEFPIFISKI